MTEKDLPKFYEIFNPILEILSDKQIIHYRVLLKTVVEKYYSDLPQELLDTKTKSGEILIFNRIAWGNIFCSHRFRLFIIYFMIEISGMSRSKAEKKWFVENCWLPADNAFQKKYGFARWQFIEISGDIRNIRTQLLDKIQKINL
jgi:hypothetical protein